LQAPSRRNALGRRFELEPEQLCALGAHVAELFPGSRLKPAFLSWGERHLRRSLPPIGLDPSIRQGDQQCGFPRQGAEFEAAARGHDEPCDANLDVLELTFEKFSPAG
jgi:hypothetical protein